MPSCAKIEKRASAEVQLVDNGTPIRQVIVAVEHKIRNLEKRKGKLESYRDLQKSGKDLTTDQKSAVSKYDEVTQCLDFARELFKQVLAISAMWEKDQKKVARKETATRIQNEVTKVKEVLVIQDTLENLRCERAREDFLTGSNGATRLEKKELELLDKLYDNSTVKRVPGSNLEGYLASAQKAADHLISTVDGKPKSFCDTNYERVRNILQVVQNSGYFDKQFVASDKEEPGEVVEMEEVVKNGVESPPEELPPKEETPAPPPAPTFVPETLPPPLVAPMLMPQPITTIIPNAVVSATPPLAMAPSPILNPGHMRAMEQSYFKHQQQYMQQMRPINEIIAGSKFFFLQDSELDSPDVAATTAPVTVAHPMPAVPIATQTFTNQNFPLPPQNVYPGMKPVPAPTIANPAPPPEHIAAVHIPGFATARPMAPATAAPAVQPAPSGTISPAQPMMAAPAPPPVIPTPTQAPVVVEVVRKEEPPAEEPQLTITEWTPEDSAAVTKKATVEESTNWADQVTEASSKEWNPADAAAGDNQFGGSWQAEGSGYTGRRGFPPRRRGLHNNNMGYRPRQSGGNGYQNGSRGGTFYRNNDPTYYQTQNGGYHNGGGNFKGRPMRPQMSAPRGERSNSNRRENRPMRSTGGFQGPTRSAAAAQNE